MYFLQVGSITSWTADNSCHFRTKSRDVLERLVKKFGYEIVASFVSDKHKKFIVHIRKMVEKQKRKKKQVREKGDDKEGREDSQKRSKPRYMKQPFVIKHWLNVPY